jgi:RimJ/RimL family protein N-acetyltransferase
LSDAEGCRFYIVESGDGAPIGPVRFERSHGTWEVHYAVAPAFRGRGLGSPLLRAALARLDAEVGRAPVQGRVKGGNIASRRIFENLGFETQTSADETVLYRRVL